MALGWVKEKLSVVEGVISKMSSKAKTILVVVLLVMIVSGAAVAWFVWDYTQNDPKFCVTCHLMQPAFDTWALSAHKELTCHDCHHMSLIEQNMLLVNFVVHRPNDVPDRHGKVIVSSKYCQECHVGGNEKRGKAPSVKDSAFHVKHLDKKLECTQCHGGVGPNNTGVHQFLPTERFCLKCHEGKEVHGQGMGDLACLNCHTDRSKDLKPDTKKCQYCHSSDENARKEVIKDGTMDVRFFAPNDDIVKKSKKIVFDPKAPMQIPCYECHQPHSKGKVKPGVAECLKCHADVKKVGKHAVHMDMDMKCKDCHKPHVWTVTEASAKKACAACHEYRSPKKFL